MGATTAAVFLALLFSSASITFAEGDDSSSITTVARDGGVARDATGLRHRHLRHHQRNLLQTPAVTPFAVVLGNDINMVPWNIRTRALTFPDDYAKWIWSAPNANLWGVIPKNLPYWFNKTFTNDVTPVATISAVLYVIVDNAALIFLDGILVADLSNQVWYNPVVPIPLQLSPGLHKLSILAWNVDDYSPAGLIATMVGRHQGCDNGTHILVRTDETWTTSYFGNGPLPKFNPPPPRPPPPSPKIVRSPIKYVDAISIDQEVLLSKKP